MHRPIALVIASLLLACGSSGNGSDTVQGAGGSMAGTAGAPSSAGTAGAGMAGGTGGAGTNSGGVNAAGSAGSGGGGQGGVVSAGGVSAGGGGQGGSAAGSAGASASGGSAGATNGGASSMDPLAKQVLMVGLSTGKATPGDTIMINRLEGRGFKVTLVADTVVTAASADGKDWILISSSEESGNLGTKLRDLAMPILCMEDGSFADMQMASARGHAAATTALNFMGTSALAGGLSGSVTIANAPPAPGEMGWGTVGAKAVVAATIVALPDEAALFGYEKGDDMIGLAAPARRVGFAAREDIASHFTEQGLKVFDIAVDWVLGLP